MVMLHPAMAVTMAVIVTIMVVIVTVMIVVIAGVEKFRLEFEDAIEIEGAALQHVGQRDLAALGAVQFCVRIDSAYPRLDLGKFSLGDEIGLVEHDDVGERDLVLGFGGVLQTIA